MNRIFTLFLVSLLSTSFCHSQLLNVTGTVSTPSSRPLVDATVFIQKLNIQTNTNSAGNFQLQLPPGNHRIEVFSIGMETSDREIDISKDLEINFILEEITQNLSEVEVVDEIGETTGMSRLRPIQDFGIYEAKKNELIILDDFAANKVSNNARQVFAKVPGLNIWESDYAGLQLDIATRGLGPSRTANFNTRQNGYDMSADALGYPESYYMPALQAVDRIEIVRGAASLQYGTQFGGLLNFRIKEAPDKPIELNFEQAVGSFGLVNSFASVGGRGEKIDYYGYYQYRSGDGWRDNSGFDSHLAFGRIGFTPNERLNIKLEYSHMDYVAQQPGGLTDDDFEGGNLEQSRRARNWFQVRWNLLAAVLDYKFSSTTSLNIRSFGLNSNRDALGNLVQIGVPDNPNENRTLIRDEFRNFGTELRLLHRYRIKNMNSAMLVGGRYYDGLTNRKQGLASSDSSASFSLINPEDPEEFDYMFPSNNYSFFVENLIYVSSKLSVTSGFRVEHIQTDSEGNWKLNQRNLAGDIIFTRSFQEQQSERRSLALFGVGASYYLNDNLSLYTNLAQNFRSITFSDLRVANPNFQLDSLITDENGYNMDLGIRGELMSWMDVDVSLFLMRYNDRIGQYELPGSTTLFRTNIGDSRHLGIESYLEADVLKLIGENAKDSRLGMFLNLSVTRATYIRSEITAIQNRKVEYVPNIMLRTGINYSWRELKATYQLSYLSEQFSDATNSTFNPNALTGVIPSYYVMDLSLEYQPGRFKFTGGVNNITNEKYFTRRAESYPGPGIIPATVRSFYLSIGLRIG